MNIQSIQIEAQVKEAEDNISPKVTTERTTKIMFPHIPSHSSLLQKIHNLKTSA